MNVVRFIREGADNNLRPVALWIKVSHELLEDGLIFVVVATESLHEAPQAALHSHR